MKSIRKHAKGKRSRVSNLFPKEKLMLQHMAHGKTPVDAVKQSYNVTTHHSAEVIASRVMRRERFLQVLENAGLTDETLARTLIEGLHAMKPLVIDKQIIDYPDATARHSFARTVLKTKGYMTPDTNEDDKRHGEPLVVKALQFVESTITITSTDNTDTT